MQQFSAEAMSPNLALSGDIRLSQLGVRGSHWQLGGRSQGCSNHPTVHTQDNPPTKNLGPEAGPKCQQVQGLRNSALREKHVFWVSFL